MTEKEWQQIKRLDISFVVIGSVGSLLITAMIAALSYLGWFDQFTDSGLLSSLDEWLVTVLIGGILLVPFLIVTVCGILTEQIHRTWCGAICASSASAAKSRQSRRMSSPVYTNG